MIENIFLIIAENLIPIFVSIISIFSEPFSRLFVHESIIDQDTIKERGIAEFAFTGQGILITPICIFMMFLSSTSSNVKMSSIIILVTGIFFVIYLWVLIKFLQRRNDRFTKDSNIVRRMFKSVPLIYTISFLIWRIITVLCTTPATS